MITSEDLTIRAFTFHDAEAMLALQIKNRLFFEEFALTRQDDFYTVAGQIEKIKDAALKAQEDKEYYFGIFENHEENLIGTISLFNIVRGASQSAIIGYFLDKDYNGKGYMTQAAKLFVTYAFTKLNLHRIQAEVQPHNVGSIRVLEKAGFHQEGLATKNLKIRGEWKDHQVLAIINPAD
ncbi:GNAT family N-acetyltransferase [Priestia flexa]|uniref:GNAT family N-acetyltransferase n=1 Tax=Priestia flexa TaxID=86664 RepID=UPI003D2F3635